MQSTMPSSLDWIPNSMASLKESLSLYDTQNPSEDEPQSHSYNVTHQLLARCNTGLNGWKSHIALVKPVGKKSELQQLGIVAQNSAEFRYSSLHGRKLAIAMILGILQFCIHCTSNQYPTKESLPLLPDGVAPLKEFPHVEDGYDKRKLGSWQHRALHMITVETAACKWGDPKQVGAPLSLPSAALPCTSTSMVSTSNRTNTLLAVALQHSKASEFHAVSANFLFAAWGISALLENEQLWQTHHDCLGWGSNDKGNPQFGPLLLSLFISPLCLLIPTSTVTGTQLPSVSSFLDNAHSGALMKNCSQLQIYMENAVFHAILSVVDNEGRLDDAKTIITHAHTQLQGLYNGWRLRNQGLAMLAGLSGYSGASDVEMEAGDLEDKGEGDKEDGEEGEEEEEEEEDEDEDNGRSAVRVRRVWKADPRMEEEGTDEEERQRRKKLKKQRKQKKRSRHSTDEEQEEHGEQEEKRRRKQLKNQRQQRKQRKKETPQKAAEKPDRPEVVVKLEDTYFDTQEEHFDPIVDAKPIRIPSHVLAQEAKQLPELLKIIDEKRSRKLIHSGQNAIDPFHYCNGLGDKVFPWNAETQETYQLAKQLLSTAHQLPSPGTSNGRIAHFSHPHVPTGKAACEALSKASVYVSGASVKLGSWDKDYITSMLSMSYDAEIEVHVLNKAPQHRESKHTNDMPLSSLIDEGNKTLDQNLFINALSLPTSQTPPGGDHPFIKSVCTDQIAFNSTRRHPGVEVREQPPDTQYWAILSTSGCIHLEHIDACGLATWFYSAYGTKIILAGTPKHPESCSMKPDLDNQSQYRSDIVQDYLWDLVPLTPGSIFVMRPNTLHVVLTLGDQVRKEHAVIMFGGHFYSSTTLHPTLMGRWRQARWDLHVTNINHDQSDQWIQRMMCFAAASWYQWYQWTKKKGDSEGIPPDLPIVGHDLACLIFMCENWQYFDRIGLVRALEGPSVRQRDAAWHEAVQLHSALGGSAYPADQEVIQHLQQLEEIFEDYVTHDDDISSPLRG